MYVLVGMFVFSSTNNFLLRKTTQSSWPVCSVCKTRRVTYIYYRQNNRIEHILLVSFLYSTSRQKLAFIVVHCINCILLQIKSNNSNPCEQTEVLITNSFFLQLLPSSLNYQSWNWINTALCSLPLYFAIFCATYVPTV